MRLSELLTAVGPRALRVATTDRDPVVTEVVLDDGRTKLGPHQMVLAVRPGREQDLLGECRAAGCAVVVTGTDVEVGSTEDDPVVATTEAGWTQLFVVTRTTLSASLEEASEGDAVATSSVHGLADAVAIMMDGTVVLYDRAHRVVAYSVQGHQIDDVRRDTILGRRTPDQWIRRFTLDRTAYQTYDDPGAVVRVAGYPDLRPRLRVAVHTGAEVLGEISVAEGDSPFADDAEATLRRAAQMAVPAMLRHRKARDVDERHRTRAMATLLTEGVPPSSPHRAAVCFIEAGTIAVLAVGLRDHGPSDPDADRFLDERLVHFLSLHAHAVSADAQVIRQDDTLYALLPDVRDAEQTLQRLSTMMLNQLRGMRARADIALPGEVDTLQGLPTLKQLADDLLDVAGRSGGSSQLLTATQHWAQLVLLNSTRSVAAAGVASAPLSRLRRFDAENGTDLVETLRVYLTSFGSISKAAAQLHLHGNTMRHRLGRIVEVSDLDLDDHDQRVALCVLLASVDDGRRRSNARKR